MSLTVEQDRRSFFTLKPELRKIVYEFYVAGLTVVLGADTLFDSDIQYIMEDGRVTVVFDATGHVSKAISPSSRNLVALFRTCRQIAMEGQYVILRQAEIRFRKRRDFINGYIGLMSLYSLDRLATDFQLRDISFALINDLSLVLETHSIFEMYHEDASEQSTMAMFYIVQSAMPNLKHLTITVDRTRPGSRVLPLPCFLRGLFQLRALSTFKMHYMGYHDHTLFYGGGSWGVYHHGLVRALEETFTDEIQAISKGKAGLYFPGGVRECSENDLLLTIGRAMVRKLNEFLEDIDVNEDEDDPREDDDEQEEFEYYYNIYRDIQCCIGDSDDLEDSDDSDDSESSEDSDDSEDDSIN